MPKGKFNQCQKVGASIKNGERLTLDKGYTNSRIINLTASYKYMIGEANKRSLFIQLMMRKMHLIIGTLRIMSLEKSRFKMQNLSSFLNQWLKG